MMPSRRALVAGVVTVAVFAGGVAAWRLTGPDDEQGAVTEILTDTVERRTLRDELTVRGELRREEIATVNSPFDGRVSRVDVEAGSVVEPGDVVVALDGRPAIAARGDFSFYRSLDVGSDGPDVRQLETILADAGYDPGAVDELYTEATRSALRAWQVDHGYGGATPEPDETVVITLATNTGYTVGARNSVAVTIGPSVPDRPAGVTTGTGAGLAPVQVPTGPPAVSVDAAAVSVTEGASVDLVLRADPAPLVDTQVQLTFGGDATADDDYLPLDQPVLWPAGASTVTLGFVTVDDEIVEPDEDFVLSIASPLFTNEDNYVVGPVNQTTVTIVDDDHEVPTLTVTADDDRVDEGQTATFTVTSDIELGEDLTVAYAVSGSVTVGDDLDEPDGELTLPAGQTEVTLALPLLTDDTVEPDETLTVTLTASPDHHIAPPGSDTVIVDDIDQPELTLRGGGTIGEGQRAAVTIVADQAPSEDLSVRYQVGGSATPGADYEVLTGIATLKAGTTSTTIVIASLDDDVVFRPSDLIVADWPARVGTVFVDEGETVLTGQALLTLTEPDFTITLTASPTDRSELAVGQAVTVTLEAGDQEVAGRIVALDDEATIDANGNETYEGEVETDTPLAAVDGANVTIDVVLDERVDALVVPLAAVGQDGTGTDEVRVVDPDTLEIRRVPVVTGLQEGSFVEVVEGLEGGELVIVDVTGGGS
ncbi:MAG: HlyD family efflux transporter periplasmic adaptor subunit [Actinomyces sp.]|nr:MAG: HlyD family efflux transporter periplasmic adaptor subunit [Actinomyces sp.]